MLVRSLRATVLLLALSAPIAAQAEDFAAEAERMMDLSFDLEEVEGRVRAKEASRAPAAAPDQARYYAAPAAPVLPLEPNSDVEQVVVFRDRALVTRVRGVTVPKGASTVTFEGLPFGLAADSLHAQAREGDLRIVGVELVAGGGDVEATERIEQTREKTLAITEELGLVRDRIESLLAQRAYLRTALTSAGDRPVPSLDQVRGTLAFVGDAEREIAAKLRKELDRARELDEELRPLLIKLENPLATGMTVRVDVEATNGGEIELGLRYQVFGARWWPSYNARLDEAGRVELEYYGMVSQHTGETWKEASLLLSTADPSVSGSLPRLEAWHLGQGYDAGVIASLEHGRGAYVHPTSDATYAGAPPDGVVSSQMSATVQGSGTAVFAIPGERTVEGDGSEQRLPIGNQTFPATIERATVPKVVPEVYRSARLRYEGQAPMLPGAVASFVGSDYVGSGAIGAVVPGEELVLAFGTDDSLDVTRQLVSRHMEHVGAGRRTVRYTFHFRITVHNYGPDARAVLVTDQVPVSEIDRVTVEPLGGTEPLPAAEEDPRGLRKWQVTVPSGGSQTIDLVFQVTAPREVQLQALQAMF